MLCLWKQIVSQYKRTIHFKHDKGFLFAIKSFTEMRTKNIENASITSIITFCRNIVANKWIFIIVAITCASFTGCNTFQSTFLPGWLVHYVSFLVTVIIHIIVNSIFMISSTLANSDIKEIIYILVSWSFTYFYQIELIIE